MVKRSTVIIVLGFLSGLSISILIIAILQSRRVGSEIDVRVRQNELNTIIQDRGSSLALGPEQTVSPDEEFTIPVILTSEEFHVIAADIDISYDPAYIEIISVDNADVFDHLLAVDVSEKDQSVTFAMAMEPEKSFIGSDTIATVTARALLPGTTKIEFIYMKNERNDSNVTVNELPGEDVLETVEPVQITIQ